MYVKMTAAEEACVHCQAILEAMAKEPDDVAKAEHFGQDCAAGHQWRGPMPRREFNQQPGKERKV